MLADPLRVSVLAGGRRTDLAVPAGLPVAELLPLLVPLLGAGPGGPGGDAARGFYLALPGGSPLDLETPLEEQGVLPGAVIVAMAPAAPPLVLDDPAEALGAEVARAAPWTSGHRAAVRLAVVVALSLLAVTGLVRLPDPVTAGALGAAGAMVLLALAAGSSRSGRPGAVPAALLACVLAGGATSAVVGAPAAGSLGRAWLLAAGPEVGATVVVTALAGAVALARRRALLLAAVLPGVMLTVLGLLARGPVPPVTLLAGLVTVLVVLGGHAPGAALALVGRSGEQLLEAYPGSDGQARPGGEAGADGSRSDLRHLATDAGCAADLLAGTASGTGVVLVVAAPLLATDGRSAAALGALLALHLVLRARRSCAALLAAAELGSGAVALVGVLGVLLLRDPAAGSVLVPGLVVVVPLLLLPDPASPVGRRRLGDLVETATAVALLPLLAVVTGLLDLVGGG